MLAGCTFCHLGLHICVPNGFPRFLRQFNHSLAKASACISTAIFSSIVRVSHFGTPPSYRWDGISSVIQYAHLSVSLTCICAQETWHNTLLGGPMPSTGNQEPSSKVITNEYHLWVLRTYSNPLGLDRSIVMKPLFCLLLNAEASTCTACRR